MAEVPILLLEKLLDFFMKEGVELISIDKRFNALKDQLEWMKSYLQEGDKVTAEDGREVLLKTLGDLRELVYDVEDVVDDYRRLFLDHGEGFSKVIRHCSPQILYSRWKIAKQMKEVTQKISDHRQNMTSLLPSAPTTIIQRVENKSQTSRYPCLMEANDIVGLRDEFKEIKEYIFEGKECPAVIGIVGMGGIGKTTIVQKISEDDDVKKHFEPIIFVNVSQTCDYRDLLKRILRKIDKGHIFSQHEKIDEIIDLLEKIQMALEHKKYMLVLDDVWTENEGSWRSSLQSALPKRSDCCVIITTRNEAVARSMGANTRHICHLKPLSPDESWFLFTKIICATNGGKCWNPNIESTGKKIVATCGGLPLAISVIGGTLLGAEGDLDKWERVLQGLQLATTKMIKDEQEQVLSILKLSYEDLPSYLKPCFLCFSMLPKNSYVFVRNMIHWWMGEGFIYETNEVLAFEIGKECMRELINRCLLIGKERDIFERDFITVQVHDLIMDMIIKIALGQNFMSLSEKLIPKYKANSRRMGIFQKDGIESSGFIQMKDISNKSKLRTFWDRYMNKQGLDFSGKQIKFGGQMRLRVLSLEYGMDIVNEKENASLKGKKKIAILWRSFIEITRLSHLVYLRIDECCLEKLPDAIGNLHYLQILCLRYWSRLKTLPPTICKLQNLTIVQIWIIECWQCVPAGMGMLPKLQHLDLRTGYFFQNVRRQGSCDISPLRGLKGLRVLSIKLVNIDQMGVLLDLQNLRLLTIWFGRKDGKNAPSGRSSSELSPLVQLDELYLNGFSEENSPVWLSPTFLPNLRFLGFGYGKLRSLGPEFYNTSLVEWKIEGLAFLFLEDLEEDWECLQAALPYLKLLKVSLCPNLKSFPLDVTAEDAIWRKGEGSTFIRR